MTARPAKMRYWLFWPRHLWHAGSRPVDLDGIPGYNRRHQKRLSTLLWISIGILAGWVGLHQVVAPDIGTRSLLWLGGCVIPHSVLVCLSFSRLKPSWREYVAVYGLAVAYMPLQVLFSISRSAAAPYLLAGTSFLFLIVCNLMMRFRFRNAVTASLYIGGVGVWLFAGQAGSQNMVQCFAICTLLVSVSTLYVNRAIGTDEMHYARLEQHFRLVLSGGKRDLWEFDSAIRIVRVVPWNASPSQPPLSYAYDAYLSLIHPQYRPALIRAIDDTVAGRADSFNLEFEMRPAGQAGWRWFQLSGHRSQRNANGAAARIVGTACDVTDRKSLHAEAERRSREFERAAREKAEFLANISHNIRTPLNAVIGATAVLAADDLRDEVREMVDTIQASAQLLLTVLNDVLNLNTSDQTIPQLEPVPFNPHELLRRCCQLMGPLALQKKLELRLSISPEVSSSLSGDAVRLRQVLINLLSNAVKFTDSGSVCLSASLEASSEPAVQSIAFAVSDTGVGIGEQAQRSLFERFEQLHPREISGPAGSGLGLAISQRLVGAMGGAIRYRGQPGSGSTFSFTLGFPVASETATKRAETLPRAPQTILPAAPLCVLVAEDNPINQRVLAGMLQRLHCEVHLAANGADAVAACHARSFDIILMDCDMPVLDGLEATRRIRQLPRFARVPIIAATAHVLPANIDACFQAGMSDTLTKPITLPRLTAALARGAACSQPAFQRSSA